MRRILRLAGLFAFFIVSCTPDQSNSTKVDQTTTSAPSNDRSNDSLGIYGSTRNISSRFTGGLLNGGSVACTITRVGKRTFLTAAHCISGSTYSPAAYQLADNPPTIEVLQDIGIVSSSGKSTSFKVSNIVKRSASESEDYALISVYLGRNEVESQQSQLFFDINLPGQAAIYDGAAPSNGYAVALGWGHTRGLFDTDGSILLGEVSVQGTEVSPMTYYFNEQSTGLRRSKPFQFTTSPFGLSCLPQEVTIKTVSQDQSTIVGFYGPESVMQQCPTLKGDSGGPMFLTDSSGSPGGDIIGVTSGARVTDIASDLSKAIYVSTYSPIDHETVRQEKIRPILDYFTLEGDTQEKPLSKLYAEREYTIHMQGHRLDRLKLVFSSNPNRRISFTDCEANSSHCSIKFKAPRPASTATQVSADFLFYFKNADGIFEQIRTQDQRTITLLNVYEARSCPLILDMTVKQPSMSQTFVWSELVFPVHSLAPKMPNYKTINPTSFFPEGQDTIISQKIDPKLGTDAEIQQNWCERLPTEANICSEQWFSVFFEAGQTCSNYSCSFPSPCKTFTITRTGEYYDGLTDEEAAFFGYSNPKS